MKYPVVCLTASFVAVTGAAFAEPAKIAGTVTDVFGPRFVVETTAGKVLVDIGPKGPDKVAIKQGEKIEIEGDRNKNQLRARRVTLADGNAYEVDKRGESWREWLLGKPAPDGRSSFASADAKKLAAEKGYQVTGEPAATKKHFTAMASKDGKNYEIDLHRNGKIVERTPFGLAEAKKLVTDNGYELIGEPRPVKKHFELLGKKDGKFAELHAHRDGKLVRARPVDATDPKWGSLVR